jgi:hypothetical protein
VSADRIGSLSYVLPIRWTGDRGLDELTDYLGWLAARAEVLVVDGSPAPAFAEHSRRWGAIVRHMPPHEDLAYASGKVNGVTTGVREATGDRVVIADDDVRYDEPALRHMAGLLDSADLVRPQNYFDPLPWHAVWDGGRSLINRALAADFPGTLGVRRDTFLAMGAYDGDVLFENLELIRTVQAFGGTVATPMDLFVRRLPASGRHFWSQRVRQAYDDFSQPARMALALSLVPGLALAPRGSRAGLGIALAGLTMAVAELGRRRGGADRVIPARVSLCAPAWVAERAVCSWLAVGARLTIGGVPYAGAVMRRAATPRAQLRRRFRARAASPPP